VAEVLDVTPPDNVEATLWRTQVGFLMTRLRDALLALIPIAESVKIGWTEGESYDEWDRITQALYESICLDAIAYSTVEGADSASFPKYGLLYRDYSSYSVIGVQSSQLPEGDFHFLRFSTSALPFDSVRCVGRAQVENLIDVPVESCDFFVRIRDGQSLSSPIRDLVIT
jgi:hypothetical protein